MNFCPPAFGKKETAFCTSVFFKVKNKKNKEPTRNPKPYTKYHRCRKVLNIGRGGGGARFRILGGGGGANFLLAVN